MRFKDISYLNSVTLSVYSVFPVILATLIVLSSYVFVHHSLTRRLRPRYHSPLSSKTKLFFMKSGLCLADFWWARSPASCEYAKWQTVHLYGFSPVWSLVWFRSVEDWEKHFLQYLHWNGFSSVWILMCERRLLLELNPRRHIVHLRRPFGTWGGSFGWLTITLLSTKKETEVVTLIGNKVSQIPHENSFL